MSSPSKIPRWINRQIIAQIILVVLFLGISFLISIQPNPFDSAPPTPPPNGPPAHANATLEMQRATAYQLEVDQNSDQTLGIVFGGTMIVVLIIGGTLLVIGKN